MVSIGLVLKMVIGGSDNFIRMIKKTDPKELTKNSLI